MKKISSVEAVRKLAVKLDATFNEGTDRGYFTFENELGRGSVRALKIFFGLEVVSFDVSLKQDLKFDYPNISDSYLHCIFIQEGFLNHSFNDTKGVTEASRFQNVIVGSTLNDFTTLELPANTKIKFVVITIERLDNISEGKRGKLQALLNDVLVKLSSSNAFSYFGDFSSQASSFVGNILSTVPNNLSNILLLEASVLNILSCQFLDHENRHDVEAKAGDLSKSEILNVIRISEFISNNLEKPLKVPDLERESGLNQKRIQKGFKHFFGMSVNKYIVNLRILRAKELIETTELSISEIVYSIGLNSRSYFSRIFFEKYGLLPNDYRKNFNIHNPTFELSYYSTARMDLDSSDFDAIVAESRINNKKKNITGCLIYHKENFFQILEGPKDVVLKTYESIKTDSRHSKIVKLYDGFKSGRTFDEWQMAFLEKPSLFSNKKLADFRLMNVELILKVDKEVQKRQSNKLRTKLMWERARNALLTLKDDAEFKLEKLQM